MCPVSLTEGLGRVLRDHRVPFDVDPPNWSLVLQIYVQHLHFHPVKQLVCSFLLCKTNGTARAHSLGLLFPGLLNTSVLVAHTLPDCQAIFKDDWELWGQVRTYLLVGFFCSVIEYEAIWTEKSSPRKHT